MLPLKLLCEKAITAALEAGKLIQKYAISDDVKVEHKDYGSSEASQVLTQVDGLSQDIILSHLLPTCEQYNIGLLTEESTDDCSRFEKDFFWCIDPIDGTLPFIKRTPGYSVSIALVAKSGKPVIGIIFDPVKGNLYHAIKGEGAFKNNEKWNLSPISTEKVFTWVCDPGFTEHKKYAEIRAKIEKVAQQHFNGELKTTELGGAAMNGIWAIENAPACYFKLPKPEKGGGSLWDFAATAAIVNELKASATNMSLGRLDLNRTDSTYMNHEGALYASDKDIATLISELLS